MRGFRNHSPFFAAALVAVLFLPHCRYYGDFWGRRPSEGRFLKVVSTAPANGALNVALNSQIRVIFSETMDLVSVELQSSDGTCAGNVQISADNFASCLGTTGTSWSAYDKELTFDALNTFAAGTVHKIRILPTVRSSSGLKLENEFLVTFTTGAAPDTTPPSTPATPAATPISPSQIDLTWSAASDDYTSPGDIVYKICYSSTSGGCTTFTPMVTTPAGATSASITGLSALTTYYFRIAAEDLASNLGTPTAEFSATTHDLGTVDTPTYAPAAGVFGSAQSVAISSGTSGATICYTTDGSNPACLVDVCTVGSTYTGSVNIASDTTLKALACKAGYTNSSQQSGNYVIDTIAPSTPASPSATAAGATQLDLAWSASTDNVSPASALVYEICQASTTGGCATFSVSYTTPAGQVSYSVTGLAPLTTYYFRVRAKDEVGNVGAATAEFSATTTDTPPVVLATLPDNGATNIAPGSTVLVRFDKAMAPASLTAQGSAGACSGSLQVSSDDFSTCVGVNLVSMAPGNTSVGLRFKQALQYGATYKIRVTTAAQSASSVPLASPFTQAMGFTVESSGAGKADFSFFPGPTLLASGANNVVRAVAMRPDGHVVVVGDFTAIGHIPRNRIAVLLPDGTVDPAFNPGGGTNNAAYTLALQTDGRIVFGGIFTAYDGTTRNRVARVHPDGLLDTSFNPGTGPNSTVQSIKIQSDGKILIGGWFTQYNAVGRNRIVRTETDGTLDTTFDPGTGADNTINSVAIQSDGKIVIGGMFTNYNGTGRGRIARLNADGTLDTAFSPSSGADDTVQAVAAQSDGKVVLGGNFMNYNATSRVRIARANTDGSLDTTFDPGTGSTGNVLALEIQSDGKIVIGGLFGSFNGFTRNRIARILTNGALDAGFAPLTGVENQSVLGLAIQSDGKIILGGDFSRYDGSSRIRLMRANTDGSLDTSFATVPGMNNATNNAVNSIALQSDGKAVLVGTFTNFSGTARPRIVRSNTDGSLDTTFNPGTGADNIVNAIALQSDGKTVIGGMFLNYNGTARNRIARVNSDGTLDNTFNPGTGVNNPVNAIAIQSDGKIVLAGAFSTYNSITRNRIARANTDGTLDSLFVPVTGADSPILAVAIQSDGKIVIGGSFTTYDGSSRNRVARVSDLGVLDVTFDPGTGANGDVRAIALQSDGKILIAGNFSQYNGIGRNRIARLNSDGSLDTSFDSSGGADNGVSALALQSDGKVVITGDFLNYNAVGRNRMARVNSDGSLDTGFHPGMGSNSNINALALQSDGKILAGGNFSGYNNALWPYLVRILP